VDTPGPDFATVAKSAEPEFFGDDMPHFESGRAFYNTEETAVLLQRTPITVLRMVRAGKLQGEKRGRGYWITADSINAMLERFKAADA
jgi:hypothetical protein